MKIWKCIISIVLAVAMMATFLMPIGAARVTYYLSDLKMAEADSEAEAKKLLTDAGYTVLDKNLNPDGSKAVYLGYKRTTNVDDAITDVRVMNMDGGFNITDYESIRQEAMAEYSATIDRMRTAAKEFAENYRAGKREAILAYRQLNYYYVENNGVKTYMGDYMLNFPATNDGFADILFKGNPTILDNIRNLLAMGVSDSGALIERIKAAVNDESVYGKKEYWEDAKALGTKVQQLKKLLAETNEMFDEIEADPDLTKEEKEVALIMPRYTLTLIVAFEEILKDIPYGEGSNYSELFDKSVITDYTVLYPFVDAMTSGQRAMAVSGQLHSILVYNSIEMTDDELERELTSIEQSYEPMSVYLGTNMDLLEGAVGVTSDALREEAATGNQWIGSLMDMATDITAAALFGAGGAILVAISTDILWNALKNAPVGSGAQLERTYAFDWGNNVQPEQLDLSYGSMFDDFEYSLNSSVSSSADLGNTTHAATSVGSTAGSTSTIVLAGLGIAIGIAMMVFSIYTIVQIVNRYKIEYTEIPANMVDAVETLNGKRYVAYQVVSALYQDGNKAVEKPGDTNGYDGERWNAIYYTKSYEAGKCMTANGYILDGAEDFGKYTPVAKFGTDLCYDLNSYNGNKSKEAVYLAFGNSNNKKSAETSVPTVVGSVFAYGAIALSGVVGFGAGMGLMGFIKRKKQKEA